MKNLLLGLMLLLTIGVFAQSTHTVDFETPGVGADWAWTVGENADNPPLEFVANPLIGGINTSTTAAKFTARLAGNPWALCYTSDDGEFTFDASNSTVTIMVYKAVISDVGFKVEGASGLLEIVIPNTVTNQWEELTFDFSSVEGNTYSTLVIIPDFTARTQENIIYFDNIQVPDGVVIGPKPYLALDVQDNFENDGWGTIPEWFFQDPGLGSLPVVSDPVVPTNNVAEYNRSGSFEYTNAQFVLNHIMDLTTRNIFEIRVYFPSSNDYTGTLTPTAALKLQNSLLGGNAWTTQEEIVLPVVDFDQWVTLTFDFGSASARIDLDQAVVQFGGEGHLTPGMFYFDDLILLGGSSYTVTLNPPNGATNVPIAVSPTLTFSVPVEMANGSVITNGDISSIITFKETDASGADVSYTGTINPGKDAITINPTSDLSNNQPYYLALNDEVIKFQGGDLIPAQSVIFTTIPLIQLDLYDNFDDVSTLTWGYWDDQQGGILDVEAINPATFSPVNTTPIVAKYTKEVGSNAYTHAFAILGGKLDLSVNNQFQMMVYSENAGSTFAIKLQNNDLAEPYTTEVTVEYTIQGTNVWELVNYDFSAYSGRTDLDKVLLMINPGLTGAGVHYFDEVYGPPFTPPAPSPIVVDAYTTDDGSAIEVQFDKDMEPEPGNHGNFNVYVDGLINPVTSTYRKTEDNTVIVLNLTAPVLPGNIITLSYLMSGTVTSLDNGVLQPFNDYPVTNHAGFIIDLKVLLEGPFGTSEMSTDLYPTYIPLDQPYNTAPWNYTGTESVGSLPNKAVDWVLIECRDAASAALATSGTVIARQAAFILFNGDIIAYDGSSDLAFGGTINESLFVVVWHRNHMNVMSATGLNMVGEVYTYDFTTAQTQAYQDNQKEVASGIWGMYGGNGLADSQIDDLDKTAVWELETGMEGYLQGDFNLDGQIDNVDKNDVWLLNNGTVGDGFQLIWQDNFDTDGAPDPDK